MAFSLDACRRGGWARARQKAAERRANPSEMEARVQNVLRNLGYSFETEFEIVTPRYPQWIDILVTIEMVSCAIEVDGSHKWHNSPSSKMEDYDRNKRAFLRRQGVPMLLIHKMTAERTKTAIKKWITFLGAGLPNGHLHWEYSNNKFNPLPYPEEVSDGI